MSVPARIGDVQVGDRARAREARVDVDDLRAALLGLHHPLEADRVALGHVRALDHDAVGVLQVLLEVGGAAAPERGPQTGDRGGVSYAGLVLDLHRAERREELLDQVVLLVVERGAAEVREAERAVQRAGPSVVRVLPGLRRGCAITRSAIMSIAFSSVELLPLRAVRAAVLDPVLARRAGRRSCSEAEPFGHSRPREIGLSGSPSIWITRSSLT